MTVARFGGYASSEREGGGHYEFGMRCYRCGNVYALNHDFMGRLVCADPDWCEPYIMQPYGTP